MERGVLASEMHLEMFDDIRRELDTTRELGNDSFGFQKAIQFRLVVILIALVLWKHDSARDANAFLKRIRIEDEPMFNMRIRQGKCNTSRVYLEMFLDLASLLDKRGAIGIACDNSPSREPSGIFR